MPFSGGAFPLAPHSLAPSIAVWPFAKPFGYRATAPSQPPSMRDGDCPVYGGGECASCERPAVLGPTFCDIRSVMTFRIGRGKDGDCRNPVLSSAPRCPTELPSRPKVGAERHPRDEAASMEITPPLTREDCNSVSLDYHQQGRKKELKQEARGQRGSARACADARAGLQGGR